MANYLYNEVKKALGGDKFSTSSARVIKDWTPNNIKALIITRNFIYVRYHINVGLSVSKGNSAGGLKSRIYYLDQSVLSTDLSRPQNGSVTNLLSSRQLSCMEEIYADSMFQGYLGVLNLPVYINKLVSERSRLRTYGYIENVTVDELETCFNKFDVKENPLYSYAYDRDRKATIQFTDTKNDDWIHDYFLRPQYYMMDSEGGKLARWFRSVEQGAEKQLEQDLKLKELKLKVDAVESLIKKDVNAISDIILFGRLKQYISKRKETLSTLNKLDNVLSKSNIVSHSEIKGKISLSLITYTIKERFSSGVDKSVIKTLLSYYTFYERVSREKDEKSILFEDISMESILEYCKYNDSISNFYRMTEGILTDIVKTDNGKLGMKVVMAGVNYKNHIPNGSLRTALALFENKDKSTENPSVYVDMLAWLASTSREYLVNMGMEGAKR